jgi:hypothetical protein
VLTAVVAGAAAWPVAALAGGAALWAMLLAAGVALLGAGAGRLPRRWLRSEGPEAPVHAAMAGIGARLVTTAALSLVAVLALDISGTAFAASVVGFYMLLLVLEVRESVREVAGEAPPRASGGAA